MSFFCHKLWPAIDGRLTKFYRKHSPFIGNITGVALGHAGVVGVSSALIEFPGGTLVSDSRRFHTDRHVGQHELNRLEVRDLRTERLTLQGILGRFVQTTLSNSGGAGQMRKRERVFISKNFPELALATSCCLPACDRWTGQIESSHRNLEALSFLRSEDSGIR